MEGRAAVPRPASDGNPRQTGRAGPAQARPPGCFARSHHPRGCCRIARFGWACRRRWRWWADRVGGMAKGYRPVRRDQPFLLPPDMREWLPADHLVWLVIEAVGSLDTRAVHAHRRTGGAGTAGYDPDMLVTLLIWAYAQGVSSSRRIEQLCRADVSFRVICAGQAPDHVTIARFRAQFPGLAGRAVHSGAGALCPAGHGPGWGRSRWTGRRSPRPRPRREPDREGVAEAGRGLGRGPWPRLMRPKMSCSGRDGAVMRCRPRWRTRRPAMSGSAPRWRNWKPERKASEQDQETEGAGVSG